VPDPLTVLFAAESAYGPTNNCIGVGAELARMGHHVVFAAERSWEGRLSALGFDERLVDMAPPAEEPAVAGQEWVDFVRDTAVHFRSPTIEQITTVLEPIWRQLLDAARYADPAYAEIVQECRPDVVVQDNVSALPALMTAGVPWVRLVSAQPLEMPGPGIPPAFSGLPSADRTSWDSWRAEYTRVTRGVWQEYDAFCRDAGAPGLPVGEFLPPGELNVYTYPAAIDYTDARPLGPAWHRVQSSVRGTERPVPVPEHILEGDMALVYLSLGSLGGADVDLMKRLIGFLAESPHRFIVSKGPRAAEFDLPDSMWGDAMVPQTTLIPLCDLVITHGGNNTTCEALHFGKPMVVLPLFWDQYDNAQRIHESGLGRRLDTYRVDGEEIRATLDALLADPGVRARAAAVGVEVRADDGVRRTAALVADVGRRQGSLSGG
jgi:MGT family glycosyltransferase